MIDNINNNDNYKYGCNNCKYSPKTYEEYCIAQRNPVLFCVDAFTEKSQWCGNYGKKVTK